MKTIFAADIAFLEGYLESRKTISEEKIKHITSGSLFSIKLPPAPGSEDAISDIYSANGDTARIRISGMLNRAGADIIDAILGNEVTSYDTIIGAIQKAKADEGVKSVIFEISSGGGELGGCDETWQALKSLSGVKNTSVIGKDLVASAAYWIASAASTIKATSPADLFGSIGIQAVYYDDTAALAEMGLKEYKIVSKNAPLKNANPSTIEGMEAVKSILNATEEIFYQRIMQGRNVTLKDIAENYGQGSLINAQNAASIGMIDGFTQLASSHSLKENIGNNSSYEGKNTPASAGTGGSAMQTLQEFMAQNPAASAEVNNLVEKAREGATAEGRLEAKAEYSALAERIMPVMSSDSYPSHVRTLGCEVLAGKKGIDAFDAVVAMHDMNAEKAKSDAAQKQTEELGAVGAEAPSNLSSLDKEFDAALQAELDKRKAK